MKQIQKGEKSMNAKFNIFMLSILMSMGSITIANAQYDDIEYKYTGYCVSINDCLLNCNGNIYSLDGDMYYPVREISEKLGFDVKWNEASQTIDISTETDKIFPYNNMGYETDGASGLWGYKDIDGNLVVENKYTDAFEMTSGLALVRADLSREFKYGYIDDSGEEVIPCIYYEARSFSDGMALVRIDHPDEGSCFFINKQGERIIDQNFYSAEVGNYSNGCIPVMKQGNPYLVPDDTTEKIWAYMDDDCNYMTEIKAEYAGSFNDNGYALVRKGWKWGFINTSFEYVVECEHYTYAEAERALGNMPGTIGNFTINVDGVNKEVINKIVVVDGITYMSLDDISGLLDFSIKPESNKDKEFLNINRNENNSFITLVFIK